MAIAAGTSCVLMNDWHKTCKLHIHTRYCDFGSQGKRRQIKRQTEYTALDSILEVRHEPKHLLIDPFQDNGNLTE